MAEDNARTFEEVSNMLAGVCCLSPNWGGREMENARPGDLNTDWELSTPLNLILRDTRLYYPDCVILLNLLVTITGTY